MLLNERVSEAQRFAKSEILENDNKKRKKGGKDEDDTEEAIGVKNRLSQKKKKFKKR